MRALEHRIPPPIVALTFAAGMWAAAHWLPEFSARVPGQALAAVVVLVIGLGLIAVAVRKFVRARTTVDPLHPAAASALVTLGIFRHTRNPMYLGMAVILAAWALWLGNAAGALLVAAFVAYITRFQIVPEERAMRANFGEEFEAYARRVRRWL